MRDEMIHIKKTKTNLYNWFLINTEREIRQNFPLIGDIQGDGVKTYISYLNSFPSDEKLRRAKLLVKRSFIDILEPDEQSITNPEKVIIDEFINYYLSTKFGNENFEINASKSKYKISSDLLSKCLKNKLQEYCGDIQQPSLKNEWIHAQTIDRWTVNTTVIVKSQGQQLRYYHSLKINNNSLNILIDKLRWMGVNETEWNQLKNNDEEAACQQLTNLCSEFMQALPDLLVS